MPESMRWRFRPALGQQLKAVSLTVVSASTDWWREVSGGRVCPDLPGDGDLLICAISSSSPRVPRWSSSFSLRLFTSHWHSPHTTLTHPCRHFTHWAPEVCMSPERPNRSQCKEEEEGEILFGTNEEPVCNILLLSSRSLSFSFSHSDFN